MPDPYRSRGGEPRTERRTDSDDEVLNVLYSGTVDEIVGWVGDNEKRRTRVVALERQRPRPRRALLRRLTDAARP